MKVSLAVQRGLKYMPTVLSVIFVDLNAEKKKKSSFLQLALKIAKKLQSLSEVAVPHSN